MVIFSSNMQTSSDDHDYFYRDWHDVFQTLCAADGDVGHVERAQDVGVVCGAESAGAAGVAKIRALQELDRGGEGDEAPRDKLHEVADGSHHQKCKKARDGIQHWMEKLVALKPERGATERDAVKQEKAARKLGNKNKCFFLILQQAAHEGLITPLSLSDFH